MICDRFGTFTLACFGALSLAACFDANEERETGNADDVGTSESESESDTELGESGESGDESDSETDTDTDTDSSDESSDDAPVCIDDDQDGFGQDCEQGPDCDDSDPYNFSESGCANCKDDDQDLAWVGCDTYGADKLGPDCDDANPGVGADQGNEICNGLAENCAGEIDAAPADDMCPADGVPVANVAEQDGWLCDPPAPGQDGCKIKTCVDEWFDADDVVGNGCECKGSSRETSNAECGGSLGGFLGVLAEGDQAQNVGVGIIPVLDNLIGNGAEDWYWVGTPENMANGVRPNAGIIQVDFEKNDNGDYRFEVYRQCNAVPFDAGLATQFGAGSPPVREWWFWDSHVPVFLNQWEENIAWPEAVYIRVFRVQNPGACNEYKLRVQRTSN